MEIVEEETIWGDNFHKIANKQQTSLTHALFLIKNLPFHRKKTQFVMRLFTSARIGSLSRHVQSLLKFLARVQFEPQSSPR